MQPEEKKLPEPHDMQLPMSHWQRLRPPTFWEKHRILPWFIFLGGVTILIATIGINIARYNEQFKKVPEQKKTVSTVPSPNPVANVFSTTPVPADWKIYDATELGVSFKYPSDWYVDLTNGPTYIRVQNYDMNTAPGRSYSPTADKGKYLTVLRKDTTLNVSTYDELHNELANRVLSNTDLGPAVIVNENQFMINGYTAYQREVRYPNSPLNDGLETYVLDGKGNIIIVSPGLDIEGGKTFYDQILSTIQFMNKKPTASSAEGKFCGGIAANLPENQCPPGYTCKLDGNYPDAGGKCVKN